MPDVAPFATRLRSKFPFAMVPRSDALLVFDGPFPTNPDAYLRERERLGVLTGIVSKRLRERLRREDNITATKTSIVLSRLIGRPTDAPSA